MWICLSQQWSWQSAEPDISTRSTTSLRSDLWPLLLLKTHGCWPGQAVRARSRSVSLSLLCFLTAACPLINSPCLPSHLLLMRNKQPSWASSSSPLLLLLRPHIPRWYYWDRAINRSLCMTWKDFREMWQEKARDNVIDGDWLRAGRSSFVPAMSAEMG